MENYVSINPDRLWARLNEVGHIGSDPKGGISRFAWEPPYKEAVMLLIRWIKESVPLEMYLPGWRAMIHMLRLC